MQALLAKILSDIWDTLRKHPWLWLLVLLLVFLPQIIGAILAYFGGKAIGEAMVRTGRAQWRRIAQGQAWQVWGEPLLLMLVLPLAGLLWLAWRLLCVRYYRWLVDTGKLAGEIIPLTPDTAPAGR